MALVLSSESSVGSAMQSATDKTVTEEGPAPTTTPASPDSSDFAANDSTVSVEPPAGSAPGEEFAGPAEQTTSYGSADAEFGGSNTPSDIGVVNENAGSTGSETQLMDDGSDAVQTHTPAQFESATGAAVNDSVTGDASADYAEPPADAGNGAVTENSGSTDSETQFANDSSAAVQTHTPASQATMLLQMTMCLMTLLSITLNLLLTQITLLAAVLLLLYNIRTMNRLSENPMIRIHLLAMSAALRMLALLMGCFAHGW